MQSRVLAPRRRQPVGGGRCRQRPAHHEAEVARAGRADEAGIDGRGEILDHGHRVGAVLGQRSTQAGGQGCGVRPGADVPVRQRFHELETELGGAPER